MWQLRFCNIFFIWGLFLIWYFLHIKKYVSRALLCLIPCVFLISIFNVFKMSNRSSGAGCLNLISRSVHPVLNQLDPAGYALIGNWTTVHWVSFLLHEKKTPGNSGWKKKNGTRLLNQKCPTLNWGNPLFPLFSVHDKYSPTLLISPGLSSQKIVYHLQTNSNRMDLIEWNWSKASLI